MSYTGKDFLRDADVPDDAVDRIEAGGYAVLRRVDLDALVDFARSEGVRPEDWRDDATDDWNATALAVTHWEKDRDEWAGDPT